MQQLHSPHLKPPPLDDQKRAQQGDIRAIVALLNQKLNPKGIRVQGDRKEQRVGILLEATRLPAQQPLLQWLEQELNALNPSGIDQIEVYGRIRGQRHPQWRNLIQLRFNTTNTTDLEIVPLSDWLRQGSVSAPPLPRPAPAHPAPPAESPVLSQFLRFHLTVQQTALMPLTGIKEILKVPATAILPVPQMPPSVLGVYNCRGNILWLVDLEVQVGLKQASSARSRVMNVAGSVAQQRTFMDQTAIALPMFNTLVIEVESQTLGLVVPDVLDIESHSPQQIQSVPAHLFSAQLLPFVQGYLTASSSPILSLKALINDSNLQVHH